jgi:hypothetical protein
MVFWLRHNFARGGREGGINLMATLQAPELRKGYNEKNEKQV